VAKIAWKYPRRRRLSCMRGHPQVQVECRRSAIYWPEAYHASRS